MNRLIAEVLDVARVRAGKLDLQRSDQRGSSLAHAAYEDATALAEQSAVHLVLERQIGCDETVRCDRERVLQVLANLLGNAIKFSASGQTVFLRCRCSPQACTFEVEDHGSGISSDCLPLVFDQFWQAPETSSKGSGLGLTIAKEIVESHGGHIGVDSLPGRGSKFFFSLPR